MSTYKVCLVGATGRMGHEVLKLVQQEPLSKDFEISAQVSRREGYIHHLEEVPPEAVDIVVDFSLPEIFDDVLAWCEKNKKPLVSGVTGISSQQKEVLKKSAQRIPILWSANMSIGIAVLGKLISQLKPLVSDFDFQIEEIHHNKKRDCPSGTALFLQNILEDRVLESSQKKAPQPLSIRGGGVFGVHRLLAISDEEMLSFEHQALNRQVFAKGALRSALWLLATHPKAGLYGVEDTL